MSSRRVLQQLGRSGISLLRDPAGARAASAGVALRGVSSLAPLPVPVAELQVARQQESRTAAGSGASRQSQHSRGFSSRSEGGGYREPNVSKVNLGIRVVPEKTALVIERFGRYIPTARFFVKSISKGVFDRASF